MKRLVAAALVGLALCQPAGAALRVTADFGGSIFEYLTKFGIIEASGGSVVIDGVCVSACTMALGTVTNLCVTDNARFGFHSAWQPGPHGKEEFTKDGTAMVWNVLPPKVRAILVQRGWDGTTAHPEPIWVDGAELEAAGVVRACGVS